jgi:hypothetical protein
MRKRKRIKILRPVQSYKVFFVAICIETKTTTKSTICFSDGGKFGSIFTTINQCYQMIDIFYCSWIFCFYI